MLKCLKKDSLKKESLRRKVSLRKKENERKILELNSKISDNIFSDTINEQDVKLIYSIPKSIKNVSDSLFPSAKTRALETILLKQYSQRSTNETNVNINITKQKVIISILKKNKLLFNNTFDFVTKEDLLY